jgi:predicted alpha-1,2-mannosidase
MPRSTLLSTPRRRGRSLLAAGIGLGLVASLAPSTPAVAAAGSSLAPFDAVNQFIGTQLDTTENKSNDAYGNTYPGAALPFGMVQPSPTTYKVGETNGLVQEKGGYEYTADQIRGFGMTRYSGTGCHQRFGGYEFPTMPYAGALAADGSLPRNPAVSGQHRSYFTSFKHADEVSQPGYYKVKTADGIATELTATRRTAVSRFDFSGAAGSTLILDASGANNRTFEVDLTIDPATRTVSGSMYGTDVCDNGNFYRAYFSTTYDQAFASFGTWKNDTMTAGSATTSVTGDTGSDQRHKTGGWVTFADDASVTAKTGFSYTSIDAAAANAKAETASSSFDQVRADAKKTWEQALGTVDVAGGTDDERTKLYTALYHSLLQPTIGQDADGRYLGYDGAFHQVDAGHDFFRRINFAGQGWDMYRSQAQLIAMLFPKVATDVNRSIVTLTQQLGKWSPGAARMSGDNYQVILSTLDAFGATDYDRSAALDSMKSTQLLPATSTTRSEGFQFAAAGFIENRKGDNATSRTLEYAADDFAVAQLAKRLGDDTAYRTFMGRSQNWQNVFDPVTQHIRPRERTGFDRSMDLSVREDKSNRGQFNQSTGFQYGWMVTHNIGELVKRRGGKEASTKALDVLMAQLDAGAYTKTGNYLSNEAAFATPWVYNWLQAPHQATDVLHRAVTELYDTTPTGLPGNDDEGALSAWYVFANLGIAPMISGTANLLVTAPMFDRVTLRSLGSDRVYTINAPGVSDGKRYTTGLKVDGVAQTKSWVGEDVGRKGGTLDFTMAATPGTWGTGADDVPPSYGDGINARNNVGTSPNGAKTMGSMDLSDWSFSRETLAAAGAAPGATIKHGTTGIEFTWPDTKPGEPDNWIPNGQRVDLPDKRADSISFLGLATNGPSTGKAVVQYTDGSTLDVPVTLGDWSGTVANGNTQLVTVSGRNNANGTTGTGAFKVLGTAPAVLDPTKIVDAVVLPQADYSGVMHIFDVATTGALVPPVTPAAVTFDDQPGADKDTYTVPSVEGVEYLVGDQVVAAGTYAGTGTVTVTARSSAGAAIAEGATTTWTRTFSSAGGQTPPVDPAPSDPSVSLGLKAPSRTFGTAVPVTGTLTRTNGQPLMGAVAVSVDGKPYRTVIAFNGQFATTLPRDLKGGTHRVTAAYAGMTGASAASRTISVRVSKATPKMMLKVSKRRSATVTVSVPRSPVTVSGKVAITVGGKTRTAMLKNGKVTIKLPVATRTGRVTVKASFKPTSAFKGSIKPGTKTVRR